MSGTLEGEVGSRPGFCEIKKVLCKMPVSSQTQCKFKADLKIIPVTICHDSSEQKLRYESQKCTEDIAYHLRSISNL
jgi:hypothetical protein